MNKLNKTFLSGNVLTAAELNLLTSKIDEIINNLPLSSDDSSNDNITDEINSAKSWITGKIEDILAMIDDFEDGHTTWDGGESFLNLFKGTKGKEALIYYGILDSEGHPFFNAIIDENGVKPAAIIGAITDNNGNLSSSIGISADQIILDGNVTLTNTLTAVEANVKNAVIGDLRLTYGLDIDTTGNSTNGGGEISLSNTTGVKVDFLETTGIDGGYVYIGKPNTTDHFGIYTAHVPNSGNSSSGVGYTGVINGARYVNGICVGAA